MTIVIPCPFCDGKGHREPIPFANGQEVPLIKSCEQCNGSGSISTENPRGIRMAFLIAKKIKDQSWKDIYPQIIERILERTQALITQHNLNPIDIDGEFVFSDDRQQVDGALESWIEKMDLINQTKIYLGVN
jgi:hypothetical protein